jgi:hypothetical protein
LLIDQVRSPWVLIQIFVFYWWDLDISSEDWNLWQRFRKVEISIIQCLNHGTFCD